MPFQNCIIALLKHSLNHFQLPFLKVDMSISENIDIDKIIEDYSRTLFTQCKLGLRCEKGERSHVQVMIVEGSLKERIFCQSPPSFTKSPFSDFFSTMREED